MRLRGCLDGLQYPCEVIHDGVIWETECSIAGQGKQGLPFRIALSLRFVYAAIEFDGQPTLCAAEVDDERSDRVLAAKLQSREATTAQLRPEEILCRGLTGPQFTSPKNVVSMFPCRPVSHDGSVAQGTTHLPC